MTPVATEGLGTRFAEAMDRLGPFEPSPHIAAAVSGGADSMALALLAHRWAGARRGRLTALVVDHGLRPGSADETARVIGRLVRLGIEAVPLKWQGVKPGTGVQEAARAARYRLLTDWCGQAGVLHLLTGHTAGDQLETHEMRRARRDAGPGTAGMSARVSFPEACLLRPLLGCTRSELEAFLREARVPWVEDPSNREERFERVRTRRRLAADDGRLERAVARQAAAAERRMALEARVHAGLAQCAHIYPEGYAILIRGAFARLPKLVRGPALARLVAAVGGATHAPPPARAEALAERVATKVAFRGASLGHCRLVPLVDGTILICRDGRRLPAHIAAGPDPVEDWDGRFRIKAAGPPVPDADLAPLGAAGWRQIPKGERRAWGIPLAVAQTLPALFRDGALVAWPGNGLEISFRPRNPVAFNGFCIA